MMNTSFPVMLSRYVLAIVLTAVHHKHQYETNKNALQIHKSRPR